MKPQRPHHVTVTVTSHEMKPGIYTCSSILYQVKNGNRSLFEFDNHRQNDLTINIVFTLLLALAYIKEYSNMFTKQWYS